jgi:hypothetical protein
VPEPEPGIGRPVQDRRQGVPDRRAEDGGSSHGVIGCGPTGVEWHYPPPCVAR